MSYLFVFPIDHGVWELEGCMGLEVQSTLSSKAGQMNHVPEVSVSLHADCNES